MAILFDGACAKNGANLIGSGLCRRSSSSGSARRMEAKPNERNMKLNFPWPGTFLAGALVLILLGCGDGWAEDSGNPPNVLFIIADDLGARLGSDGDPMAVTPNLDRLAGQGVVFRNAFCQFPTCGPSRASLFSGKYPFETGYESNKEGAYDKALPELMSLPRLFRENGYFTARVGKIFHMSIPTGIGEAGSDDAGAWDVALNNTGWDALEENWSRATSVGDAGARPMAGVRVRYDQPDIADIEMADGAGAEAVRKLLRENHPDKTGKPFFLAYGIYRPHPPMIVPKRHWDAIDRSTLILPEVPEGDRDDVPPVNFHLKGKDFDFIPEPHDLNYVHAFYAAVHFIDSLVGEILAELESLGLAKDTVVVFTGDQGFLLGEHGHWHKSTMFDPSCRVPLIIVDPRRRQQGAVCEGLAGLIDLYPTLCELAGVEPRHALSGKSLAAQLDDVSRPTKAMELTQGRPGAYSLRTRDFRYTIWKKKGRPVASMLYDLAADPDEFTNLMGNPDYQAKIEELDRQLTGFLRGKP
jgi:iduronate 2-sulfatase